jgi:hypothetical protein
MCFGGSTHRYLSDSGVTLGYRVGVISRSFGLQAGALATKNAARDSARSKEPSQRGGTLLGVQDHPQASKPRRPWLYIDVSSTFVSSTFVVLPVRLVPWVLLQESSEGTWWECRITAVPWESCATPSTWTSRHRRALRSRRATTACAMQQLLGTHLRASGESQ